MAVTLGQAASHWDRWLREDAKARIPLIEETYVFTADAPFTFTAGGRRNGKTSAARDAFEEAGRRGTSGPWLRDWQWAGSAAANLALIDAGIVADPLEIREADLRTFSRDELHALEHAPLLPNVIAEHLDGIEPRTRLRARRPCITSLP